MRLTSLPVRVLLFVTLVATVAACPSRTRRPLVPDVPTTGDAEARSRFQEARSRFERDESLAAAEFEAIAEAFPDDPVAAYALLYAGMAALKSGDYAQAVSNLARLDEEPGADRVLRDRGRLLLGLALAYQGEYDAALPLLRAHEDVIDGDGERAEWLAAMAEATGRGAAPLGALPYYDRWYELARASERVYILARLDAIASGAAPDEAQLAYQRLSDRRGPSAAVLGMRVAADLDAAGDGAAAARLRADLAEARRRIGLAIETARADGGDPGRIGAIVPLTGSRERVGDLAMRGLAMAAGTFGVDAPTAPRPFALSVRDDRSSSAGAAAAVDALAAEGVIAAVGPVSGSVDVASERAHALGLPLLSLDPRGGHGQASVSPFVFHMMHAAEDRAAALARHAYGAGVRDFAVLAPKNGYGRTMAGAFAAEVARLGGQIVVEHFYDPGETSFPGVVKRVLKPWQAIFIPDSADRLELIAPALAAANLMSLPIHASRPRHGRKILLLSTAEFVSPRYLRGSGRYSHGAVFAPGFYPDRADRRIGDFVERYELAFGRLPTALDAYAYDAALVLRAAVDAGAHSRGELAGALLRTRGEGLTGPVAFDASRRRADDGLLYTVEATEAGDFVIRALRD